MTDEKITVDLKVNGKQYRREVEPRILLVDVLRRDLRLTGTHVGCNHGVCGACTIIFEGRTARSCLLFAVQANGAEIATVESLAGEGPLNDIQKAFHEHHALQCGFCTPGFLMTTTELLSDVPNPSETQIRSRIAGNLCRCTGYVNIVRAVRDLAERSGRNK